MPIHPTAVVAASAEVDSTVEIGAYAIVEPGARIGADTVVYPHAYVASGARLGRGCQIHPFAVVGHVPQDTKYDGSPTYAEVGDETVIREGASVHRGSAPESKTVIGKRCLLMAAAHVAHNCTLGDDVVLVNAVQLAGHVSVGNRAFLGGAAMAHQFVRLGEMVMIRAGALCTNDVSPFMLTDTCSIRGVNSVGMRRAGLSDQERHEIRTCHKLLYRSDSHFRDAIERVCEMVETAPGRRLAAFLREPSERGYLPGVSRVRTRKHATPDES